MPLDDLLRHPKPKSGSSLVLGCVERFEDAVTCSRVHALAVVSERDAEAAPAVTARADGGPYLYYSMHFDCIDAIGEEIRKRRANFASYGHHFLPRAQLRLHDSVLQGDFSFEQIDCRLDYGIDLNQRGHGGIAIKAEREARNMSNPLQLRVSFFEETSGGGRQAIAVASQEDQIGEGLQRIVNLVGYRVRHAAKRGKLFTAQQGLFSVLAGCNIDSCAEPLRDCAVRIEQRTARDTAQPTEPSARRTRCSNSNMPFVRMACSIASSTRG